MKAKIESYIRYLRDDIINNDIENSNISSKQSFSEKKLRNYQIEDEDEKITENGKNKKQNFSFNNFVEDIKNYDYQKTIKWKSDIHSKAISKNKNIYKIKLTELNQNNYINPLLILQKDYINEKYDENLFENEIKHIEDEIQLGIENNNENENLIDELKNRLIPRLIKQREKLELNNKILKYYTIYYIENNFEKITPSLSLIKNLNENVEVIYNIIHKQKIVLNKMKVHNIKNTIQLVIKKKKYENLSKLKNYIDTSIYPIFIRVKNLKLKLMNYDYINFHYETINISKEIDKIKNNLDNANIIRIVDTIKEKLNKKTEKFSKKVTLEIDNIFDSKRSNILQLFYLYSIDSGIENKNNSNLFAMKMEKNYKLKSKKIILETIHHYKKRTNQNRNSITTLNLSNQKLSTELENICIEENNLIPCIKTIINKLKNLADIFIYYFNLIVNENKEDNYENLRIEIKQRKNYYYEIIDKHLSKVMTLLNGNNNKNKSPQQQQQLISKKNILIILNLICLFEKLLKLKFQVDYSKYLNLSIKNYLLEEIKNENRNTSNKILVLLANDVWDKTTLESDSSFFKLNKIKEKIPFYLKKFIVFFNEDDIGDVVPTTEINISNVDDIFNYINNDEDNNVNFEEAVDFYLNDGIKLKNSNNKITILNKEIIYDKLYVTNSSCCLLKGIEEQVINLIMFDSLIYEIFLNLYNTIDFYIFIVFRIFLGDYNYLSTLLKNLNINEMQYDISPENFRYWSDITTYQERYGELKKFYTITEKKFCDFFSSNKKFESTEEKQDFINSLLPKIEDIFFSEDIDINENNNEKNDNENNKDNNENNLETLNINGTTSTENNNEKEKENLGFFSRLRFSYDGTNDINKSKDNSVNTLKEKENDSKKILITQIQQKINSTHLKQIIILISCMSTIYKIMKRLENFTKKIELDFQRDQIIELLTKLKILIEQIKYFYYMKISVDFIEFSKISPDIENFNWAPGPEEGSNQLFEASPWVEKLNTLIEIIINEVNKKFNDIFDKKKIGSFFSILLKYVIGNIQNAFAKIKKCDQTGRSIMLKDLKFLKQAIENILKKNGYNKIIDVNQLFDIIFQYVNAWYYDGDELLKFIVDNNIQYKYFEGILNTSPVINALSYSKKNELVTSAQQKYFEHFRKIITSFQE